MCVCLCFQEYFCVTVEVLPSLSTPRHRQSHRSHALFYDDTEMAGLKTLKPSSAVDMMRPGICGWKWISLTLVCPWWMNRSCAGNSANAGSSAPVAGSSSASTDRSHTVTWLSRLATHSTDSSCGAHSIDDTAPLWYLKCARGLLLSRIARRSHTCREEEKKVCVRERERE
jgi:hypothetical protein